MLHVNSLLAYLTNFSCINPIWAHHIPYHEIIIIITICND